MNGAPDNHNRVLASWLLVCCALVFAMVVLGGVTRLTGSGLSMVDWKPIMGALPPLSDADWQEKYELYQQSPEFRNINSHMDVHDFKGIFWLEYLHRLLGRTIGLVFALPFAFFVARGCISWRESPKYLLMFVLGGLQGLLGWYMVKSGLVDVPRVSQYRLTAHLGLAFTVYAYMLWVALSLLYPADQRDNRSWFRWAIALFTLICITIVSGGFVAGLRAGLIFNTFPTMGGSWIPQGIFALEPWWRNFFDNMTTVQFDHRWLAKMTLLFIVVFWLRARKAELPALAVTASQLLLGLGILQVTLGITTLLMRVPVWLGASHQGVAMLLFTAALLLVHSLRAGGKSK